MRRADGDMASMIDPPPPDLAHIQPFLQRSRELAEREPVIAYFCKYYAAKLAVRANATSTPAQTYVLSLVEELERVGRGPHQPSP